MKKNIRVTEPSAEMQMKIRRARIAIASQKRRTMECPYCHHNTIVVFEDTAFDTMLMLFCRSDFLQMIFINKYSFPEADPLMCFILLSVKVS